MILVEDILHNSPCRKDNLLTPYLCSARRRSVFNPANNTPAHMGKPKSMFRAKAVPITIKIQIQISWRKEVF